jgi:hypothetical protein
VADKVQTGWKISTKAKDFVAEYANRAGISQWAAAEHILETLAENPGMIEPPSQYRIRFVANGPGEPYYAQCVCTETFNPEKHGKSVERFSEWIEVHRGCE